MNGWNNMVWSDATGDINTNNSRTPSSRIQGQGHNSRSKDQASARFTGQQIQIPSIIPPGNLSSSQEKPSVGAKPETFTLVHNQDNMSSTLSAMSGHGGNIHNDRESSHRHALSAYQPQQPYPPQFIDHSHHPVYYQQGQVQLHYQPYQSGQQQASLDEASKSQHPPPNNFSVFEGAHFNQNHGSSIPPYEPNTQQIHFSQTPSYIATQGEEQHGSEGWDQSHQYPSTPSIASQSVQTRIGDASFPTPKQSSNYVGKERHSSKSSVSSPNIKYEGSPVTSSSYASFSGNTSFGSQSKSNKPVAKRSRMGCLTCRQRKKRCSESKPKCAECSRLRLNCVWPKPGTERKNKPKEAKEEENTINHEIYGKIKVLRGIVEYRSN